MAGAFLTKRTVYVIPAQDGFHRWLPRQQRAFAGLLERSFAAPRASSWEKASVIKRLARLPITEVPALVGYLQDADVSVVEAALGALVRLDAAGASAQCCSTTWTVTGRGVAMYALPGPGRPAGL
ncbi:MAG: hypothetical protein R3F43_11630 [bacterium]